MATITISTDPGCQWFASDDRSWIEVTSNPVGSGSGTVTFSVEANPEAARFGFIYLGGHQIRINQDGAAGAAGGGGDARRACC